MKKYLHPLLEDTEVESEFGFDTAAAKGRSVAKRMFELLTSVSSNRGLILLEQKTSRLCSRENEDQTLSLRSLPS